MTQENNQHTAQESQALKQVEFYFSDSNYFQDKFLFGEAKKNDGMVKIETIASFKKMRDIGVTDVAKLAEVLRTSEKYLKVSECGTMVGRTSTEPYSDLDNSKRVIYVKGLNKEATLEDLQKFFTELNVGTILSIRMRRFTDKEGKVGFKGSAFVEFEKEEDAAKVLETGIKIDDKDAIVMLKNAYVEAKKAEYAEMKASRGKGKKDTAGPTEEEKAAEDKKTLEEAIERFSNKIIKFENLNEGLSREDLREHIEAVGTEEEKVNCAWVDFTRGLTSGYIRLAPECSWKAVDVVAKLGESEKLGKDSKITPLEGEEETTYIKEKLAFRKMTPNAKRKRHTGGRGGHSKKSRTN